jgi:hypothetical protein
MSFLKNIFGASDAEKKTSNLKFQQQKRHLFLSTAQRVV